MKLIVPTTSGVSAEIPARAQRSRAARDCRAKGGRRMWMLVTKGEVVRATVRRGIRPQRKTFGGWSVLVMEK
jgi:hypothetical protein